MAARDFSIPDPILEPFIGKPQPCFMCGHPIRGFGVYWHGFNAALFVHVNCAKKLGRHLISDAIKAKMELDEIARRPKVRDGETRAGSHP